jgi:hypothetical protein
MTVQWEQGGNGFPLLPASLSPTTRTPISNFNLRSHRILQAPVYDQTAAAVTAMSFSGVWSPLTVYYARVRALNRGNRPTILDAARDPPEHPPWARYLHSAEYDLGQPLDGRWPFPSGSLSQRDARCRSAPRPRFRRSGPLRRRWPSKKPTRKMVARGDVRQTPLYLSEIRLDRGCPAVESDDLLQPVSIDVGFALVGGYVNSPGGLLRPETLRLYRLDETDGLWVRVPNSRRAHGDPIGGVCPDAGGVWRVRRSGRFIERRFRLPHPLFSRAEEARGSPSSTCRSRRR